MLPLSGWNPWLDRRKDLWEGERWLLVIRKSLSVERASSLRLAEGVDGVAGKGMCVEHDSLCGRVWWYSGEPV
jgi:hypothetical protein